MGSGSQNETPGILRVALSESLGLWFAEHNVGSLRTCTFRNFGNPIRKTKRRKSQNMHFQNFWKSGSHNKTSEISKMHFQTCWDSNSQNNTSEISKNALSEILRLQFAEQSLRHLKECTFRTSETPIRRTRRQESEQMHFQKLWDSNARNNTS